jgi:transcriptional regulator with XRE-family HTH domain
MLKVDFANYVRRRLKKLGLEQRDLAAAAHVTESYISQLLTGKKAPPARQHKGLYTRMEAFLKLSTGELSNLAALQRKEQLKRMLGGPPEPLFKEVRQMILSKCAPPRKRQISAIFEGHHFGELERLVTQKHLAVGKEIAKKQLGNEEWIRIVARLSKRSQEQMRAIIREFLAADLLSVSIEKCVPFLDQLLESWDIDLSTFGMEIAFNARLVPEHLKRFEFVEQDTKPACGEEPGLTEFLGDPSLSNGVTEQEIAFLKNLRFQDQRPSPLYYYRELQNLRDPLSFRAGQPGN